VTFRHQRKHLPLAVGELVERTLVEWSPNQPGDHGRIEDAFALVESLKGVDKHGDIRDAFP
jgi:hypothetical protein